MTQECVSVRLFGRFCILRAGMKVEGLDAPKLQELLSYLFLYRHRPHSRERLAGLLWSDQSSAQSKKHLRQTLWEVQAALERPTALPTSLLHIEADWVQINGQSPLWLDVEVFEQAAAVARGVAGETLTSEQAHLLQTAVDLYQGDLLDGCYQEWCLFERERLQNLYLGMLDKLMSYCEQHGHYEAGLSYGARSLSVDHARELTHQRLMRLYVQAGDRSGALRQHERCVAALERELSVPPSSSTLALYHALCAGTPPLSPQPVLDLPDPLAPPMTLATSVERLKRLSVLVTTIQHALLTEIQAIEYILRRIPE